MYSYMHLALLLESGIPRVRGSTRSHSELGYLHLLTGGEGRVGDLSMCCCFFTIQFAGSGGGGDTSVFLKESGVTLWLCCLPEVYKPFSR